MGEFYWCLTHDQVEEGTAKCRAADRLGPYDSAAAARAWKERADARNEAWKAEDERWHGERDG